MGCDIHLEVEQRIDGRWKRVAPTVPCPYQHNERGHCVEAACYGPNNRPEFYIGRNYVLFGVLAGVRCDGPPVVEPRGYPSDISPEALKELEVGVEHSRTWLTVTELLNYDWSANVDGCGPNESAGSACAPFLTVLHKEISKLGHPDDVRLVFGFDN